MNDWQLTEDEVYKFIRGVRVSDFEIRPMLEAQARKLVEWLNERRVREYRGETLEITQTWNGEPVMVLHWDDWQALRKGVGS